MEPNQGETLSDRVSLETDTETYHRQERVSIKMRLKMKKMEWYVLQSLLLSKNMKKALKIFEFKNLLF